MSLHISHISSIKRITAFRCDLSCADVERTNIIFQKYKLFDCLHFFGMRSKQNFSQILDFSWVYLFVFHCLMFKTTKHLINFFQNNNLVKIMKNPIFGRKIAFQKYDQWTSVYFWKILRKSLTLDKSSYHYFKCTYFST